MSKILIIENNIELLQSLERLLEKEGYEVDTTYDAILGLSYLVTKKYDLLILNLHLERITSKDIISSIKSRNINIPVIGLTSKEVINEKLLSFNNLLNEYLALPFYSDELLYKINKVLTLFNENKSFKFFDCDIEGFILKKGNDKEKVTGIEIEILDKLKDKDICFNNLMDFDFKHNDIWAYISSINNKLRKIKSNKKIIIENENYKVVDL